MIKVDNFCFVFSLRTGPTIIGIFFLIAGIWDTAVAANALAGDENEGFATPDYIKNQEPTKDQVTAYLVVRLISGILEILSASSLIILICKFKPSLMIPTLILIPVALVVMWITLLAIAGFHAWVDLTVLALQTLLGAYFWVCILSFWKQQTRAGQEPV